MKVGFLGLGHMGRGVARNLMKAGHTLTVWNRSSQPVAELAGEGATAADAPADALQGEVAISMLATDAALREVLLDSGALDRAAPGLVHVNMATVSVALAQELAALHAARGLGYVAAPVFGRPEAAAAGGLHVMAAGAPEAVARVKPLLEAVGASYWPLGDAPERANVVKLAGNFTLASMIETLGEVGALAKAWGVEPADAFEVLTSTLFAAPAYKTYAPMIAEGRFEPAAFKLPLGQKDVRLALEAGEARNVSLPIASLLRDHFIEAVAAGDGEKDWSALGGGAFRRAGLRN